MKKMFLCVFLFSSIFLFAAAALAGEDVSKTGTADRQWFKPTLRVGYAFDIGDTEYSLMTEKTALAGLAGLDLDIPSAPRVYLATELPVAVTDRLTLSLGGSWSFYTSAGSFNDLQIGTGGGWSSRRWERDTRGDWATADFTASYAFVKDVSIIKDLSVVGALRWNYTDMHFSDPRVVGGAVASNPADTTDIEMQYLTPVFGLACTLAGRESGFFGGDIKLGVLAGPIAWSKVEWEEQFATPTFQFRFKGHPSHGYVVNAYAELPVFSGTIRPGLDGSLSFFADYTRTSIYGSVDGERYFGGATIAASPYRFQTLSNVMVFGINASLEF
jgi:hypothetical protein